MRALTIALALAFAAACSHGGPAAREKPLDTKPAPPLSAGEALYWDVLGGGEHARIPAAIGALAGESAPHALLLAGTAHLWRLAEPLLARQAGPDDARATVAATVEALKRYSAAVPSDRRVPTWLAPALINAGRSMEAHAAAIPDPAAREAVVQKARAQMAAGWAIVDEGVRADPRFNLFGRMMEAGKEPIGSARFAQAVADVSALHDARLGVHLDPREPDLGPLLRGKSACTPEAPPARPALAATEETTFNRDPRCWNTWKTPFAYEGFWLYSGDVIVKSGDAHAARVMYENARKLPSYRRWPYASMLEERIANVERNARLYQDGDRTNDPPLAFEERAVCVVCHATQKSSGSP